MASRHDRSKLPDGALVSVVIPAFGRRDACRRAVESALNQSLAPYEVVVVDDGSAPPLRLDLADERVRLVRLPANMGPSVARNRGVKAATGDWVAFLDSDDYWQEDKLARQLAGHRPSERVLLACNVTVADEGGTHPYNVSAPRPPLDEWVLVHRQSLQSSGLILPRVLMLEYPFDERLRHFEDWDLVLRLGRAGVAIDYVADCLATYDKSGQRDGSACRPPVAELLPWLLRDDTPVDAATRYRFYLISLFRRHFRETPSGALATLRRLFNATPNATLVTFRSIGFALKRFIAARLPGGMKTRR